VPHTPVQMWNLKYYYRKPTIIYVFTPHFWKGLFRKYGAPGPITSNTILPQINADGNCNRSAPFVSLRFVAHRTRRRFAAYDERWLRLSRCPTNGAVYQCFETTTSACQACMGCPLLSLSSITSLLLCCCCPSAGNQSSAASCRRGLTCSPDRLYTTQLQQQQAQCWLMHIRHRHTCTHGRGLHCNCISNYYSAGTTA